MLVRVTRFTGKPERFTFGEYRCVLEREKVRK